MSFKPFHKLIKKNIEFHNDQRDALDVEIKKPHHRDQICTVKVISCNLMPKRREHDE